MLCLQLARRESWHRILIVLLVIGPLGLALIVSVASGYFAPLQTSRVVDIGICTQEHEFVPVQYVPSSVKQLFICGILEGSTHRYVSFTVFYEEQGIYGREFNLSTGYFFVPLQSEKMHFVHANTFPPGRYRLTYSYTRAPVETVFFWVKEE